MELFPKVASLGTQHSILHVGVTVKYVTEREFKPSSFTLNEGESSKRFCFFHLFSKQKSRQHLWCVKDKRPPVQDQTNVLQYREHMLLHNKFNNCDVV